MLDLSGKSPNVQEEDIKMESYGKFKHHLVRKHNQIGSKTIKVFKFNDYVAAKAMCDDLNAKAAETNPAFRFEIITLEVK
jgi:hypothetical protein